MGTAKKAKKQADLAKKIGKKEVETVAATDKTVTTAETDVAKTPIAGKGDKTNAQTVNATPQAAGPAKAGPIPTKKVPPTKKVVDVLDAPAAESAPVPKKARRGKGGQGRQDNLAKRKQKLCL
jgi:hypothetical protein